MPQSLTSLTSLSARIQCRSWEYAQAQHTLRFIYEAHFNLSCLVGLTSLQSLEVVIGTTSVGVDELQLPICMTALTMVSRLCIRADTDILTCDFGNHCNTIDSRVDIDWARLVLLKVLQLCGKVTLILFGQPE